uniref:Replication protein A subunit n=1 Tax=Arcella intermedia TaxID=1963864 RepID=A0A6B2L3J5_9EUKA
MMDSGGSISATIFNEGVDRFFPLLEVGNLYLISRATIKSRTGNRRFNSIKHDCEMTLNNSSVVVLFDEPDDSIPMQDMNAFKTIAEIESAGDGEMIDMVGIVYNVGEVIEVPSRKDGTILMKRNVTLLDDTGASIDLTLWGETAKNFAVDGGTVLFIKNVKVSEFSGKSLTASRNTRIELEPAVPRVGELKNWFESQNEGLRIHSLSRSGGSGPSPWKNIKQGKEEAVGQEKAVFFRTLATIMFIKHDENAPLYYLACPVEGCNKKVTENGQNWDCTKCGKTYPNYNARYVLSLRISDSSLSDWATAFSDSGVTILNRDANQVKQMRDRGDPELEYIFEKAVYSRFVMTLKAHEEPYNDEQRVKITVQAAERPNYVAESTALLEKIAALNNSQ